MTLPAAADRVFGTFSGAARRASPPTLPPAGELPAGDLRDAIAEVEAIWQRLQPLQDEGTALFRERKTIHREDEAKRQEAAAVGRKLPASALEKADAHLLELVDRVRPLRSAYEAAKNRLAGVDAQAWQAVADAAGEQVDRDRQAVTGAVIGLRDALDGLRRSSERQRWAAARGLHSGWMPEPVLTGGRAYTLVLDELAGLADRLAAPPQIAPDPEWRTPQDVAPPRREPSATKA